MILIAEAITIIDFQVFFVLLFKSEIKLSVRLLKIIAVKNVVKVGHKASSCERFTFIKSATYVRV